jgi:tetratricopeptide (TPR) repeat protein
LKLRRLPVALAWAVLLLAAPGSARAQPAEPPCCEDADQALRSYVQGKRWAREGSAYLEAARESLCSAACCLPEPDQEAKALSGIAREPYLPYLYLGRAYQLTGDHCHALGSFNLSQCEGDVESYPDLARELRSWRGRSRSSRPPTRPEFGRGLRAYEKQEWREAAEYLARAFEAWDDDGEPVRISGRWGSELPYLPRYFLARALLEDGCVRVSAALLRCSRLSRCQLARARYEDPGALLARAQERLEQLAGAPEPAECDRWRDLALEQAACCSCATCELR